MFFMWVFLRAQLLEIDFMRKRHEVEELALFQGAPWLPIAKKPSLVGFQRTEDTHSSRKGNLGLPKVVTANVERGLLCVPTLQKELHLLPK